MTPVSANLSTIGPKLHMYCWMASSSSCSSCLNKVTFRTSLFAFCVFMYHLIYHKFLCELFASVFNAILSVHLPFILCNPFCNLNTVRSIWLRLYPAPAPETTVYESWWISTLFICRSLAHLRFYFYLLLEHYFQSHWAYNLLEKLNYSFQ